MTYLPELRESLVKAAERRQEPRDGVGCGRGAVSVGWFRCSLRRRRWRWW
jgi:hypothetical protein